MPTPHLPRRLRHIRRRRKDRYANYPTVHLGSNRRPRGLPSNLITTTKYTLLNFIPKNLFEQFRRMTNCYFLMIVIITFIPAISPLTPWTSVLPLAFVLGVTALKEGYEDIQRWKADNTVNNLKYTVYRRNGTTTRKKSKELKVGDIVQIEADQFLPADIVPLVTALDDGICFIETAQLDGETNLKIFKAPPATNKESRETIVNTKGAIAPEGPNHELYSWKATLTMEDGSVTPLNEQNLLLRGAKLKNTPWVVGVVIYTGSLTKLSLNQKLPPSKFSTIERRLNKCVILIFSFKMSLVIVITICSGFFNTDESPDAFYLDFDGSATFQAIKDFFAYFALLSFMIPMSLMVTLEVVKVVQGKFMEWDKYMALDPTNTDETGMKPKTTNLNDELAMVRYIFSDKTGTLTENCMEFRQVSVGGQVYANAGDGELIDHLDGENGAALAEFLTNLAVCQNVVPDPDENGEIVYKAQSPDEAALCDGARKNGYAFTTRTQTEVTVLVRGEPQTFRILNVLPFSSKRARMTVVVRHPDGTIRAYSKGSDAKMVPLLSKVGDANLLAKTQDDIEIFSKEGLRTLIVGYKFLSEEEYEAWAALQLEAETDLSDGREKKLSKAAKALENEFQLLGCTAIEDKLQKEVPETIHNLLRANIKVWMITGDKQATAINIGYSCKLLKQGYEPIVINAETSDSCGEQLRQAVELHCGKKKKKDQEISLVIDGGTLTFALNEHSENFLKITSICHSVVCCRVSPLQKALIVRLMKEYTHDICLAIGDGANDVSMIQEAHIGIGIFGKEGTQAARSSDYAIREFRHVRRLLTVHGRYSYVRNAGLIQYSIYKNAAAFLVQFWFAFYCGYSATTIYDDWIITFFNIFFTSVPPFFFAIFEKDITEDVIDEYPEAYRYVQTGRLFTYSSLFFWFLSAIWHSLVFFYGSAIMVANEPFISSGRTFGLKMMGNMASSVAIVTVILMICTITNLWNVMIFLGIVGSIICYIVMFCVESFISTIFPRQYYMFFFVISNPNFWVMFLLVIIICLTPDVLAGYMRRQFFPDDWMILQEAKHFNKFDRLREDMKARKAEEERKEQENNE